MTWEQLYTNYWQYRDLISEAQNRGLTPEQARSLVLQERLRQEQEKAELERQEQERIALENEWKQIYKDHPESASIIENAKNKGMNPSETRRIISQTKMREQHAGGATPFVSSPQQAFGRYLELLPPEKRTKNLMERYFSESQLKVAPTIKTQPILKQSPYNPAKSFYQKRNESWRDKFAAGPKLPPAWS